MLLKSDFFLNNIILLKVYKTISINNFFLKIARKITLNLNIYKMNQKFQGIKISCFPKELFLDEVHYDELLTCPICLQILKDPIMDANK